jgi:hypothetical protein
VGYVRLSDLCNGDGGWDEGRDGGNEISEGSEFEQSREMCDWSS